MPTVRGTATVGMTLVIALMVTACGLEEVADSTTSTSTGSTTTTPSSTTTTTVADTTTSAAPTTVPTPPDVGVLLVVGDWGSGTMPQGAVAGAMQRYAEQTDVSAILTTGDNFMSDDFEFLMEPFGWATQAGIPFWITWGNHDVESQTRIDGINEVFDSPPRWTVHRWGDVDVVIIDSNQITSPNQAAFLLSTLESSDRPTILAMHHPPYSCTHQEETIDLVNTVVDVLDDDVVMVLGGHDHSYQRFENEGTTFIVTGGGGSTLLPLSSCPPNHPEMEAGDSVHHFLALSRIGQGIVLEAIDVNDGVVDEVTIPVG